MTGQEVWMEVSGLPGAVRTGVWLFPDAPSPAIVDAARAAEEAGLDEFWLGDEGVGRDPFVLLAAAAMVTERILLGVAVTNPYLRHPAATAAAAATVQELSGGRVVLGIGTGGDLALGPVGIAREQPFARVADAVRVMRGVTTAVPVAGYDPPPHALPRSDVPIYIGARSERLNRLASSAADGVFLGGIPRGSLAEAVGWARSVRPVEVAVYVNAAFDPAEREHLRGVLLRPLLDGPLATRVRLGIDDTIAAAADRALVAGDDRPARAVIEDRILDEFVLAGDRDQIGRGLADLVLDLQPTSIGLTLHPGDDPIGTVHRGADVLGRARRHVAETPSRPA